MLAQIRKIEIAMVQANGIFLEQSNGMQTVKQSSMTTINWLEAFTSLSLGKLLELVGFANQARQRLTHLSNAVYFNGGEIKS